MHHQEANNAIHGLNNQKTGNNSMRYSNPRNNIKDLGKCIPHPKYQIQTSRYANISFEICLIKTPTLHFQCSQPKIEVAIITKFSSYKNATVQRRHIQHQQNSQHELEGNSYHLRIPPASNPIDLVGLHDGICPGNLIPACFLMVEGAVVPVGVAMPRAESLPAAAIEAGKSNALPAEIAAVCGLLNRIFG